MITRDDGNAAVELVMLAPALLLLLALIVGAGRILSTKSSVETVAREAARSASQASSAEAARAEATARAAEVAAEFNLSDSQLSVETDPGSFERGTPLSVRVHYKVRLSDLPAFGFIPGSFNVTARHVELAERFKSR